MPPRVIVTIEVEARPRLVLDVLDEGERRRRLDWLRNSIALRQAMTELDLLVELLDGEEEGSS
jgi:hypothetical protein